MLLFRSVLGACRCFRGKGQGSPRLGATEPATAVPTSPDVSSEVLRADREPFLTSQDLVGSVIGYVRAPRVWMHVALVQGARWNSSNVLEVDIAELTADPEEVSTGLRLLFSPAEIKIIEEFWLESWSKSETLDTVTIYVPPDRFRRLLTPQVVEEAQSAIRVFSKPWSLCALLQSNDSALCTAIPVNWWNAALHQDSPLIGISDGACPCALVARLRQMGFVEVRTSDDWSGNFGTLPTSPPPGRCCCGVNCNCCCCCCCQDATLKFSG